MNPKNLKFESEFYTNSEILPELTAYKIRDILLISSLYNIFNMEEGGILASQINNEYKGLRLENPPRILGVSSMDDALSLLKEKDFDMVLIVPHLNGVEASSLGLKIKKIKPNIPVILLSQNTREISLLTGDKQLDGIDGIYRWFGNPDLLLAIVKNNEDHKNVEYDTRRANVRVVVFVEDSPDYYSYLLPIFYKEIVNQTHALMEVGLTEKQRALTLQQRPKILLAKNYEEGLEFCLKYKSCLFCLASDTRIPKDGKISADSGFLLLSKVQKEIPGLPILMMSTEGANRERAEKNGFMFLDKNSPNLLKRIHNYFLEYLGFGDFIFRMPNGIEVDRAPNFLALEEKLNIVPNASIAFHASQHHFSRWIMARSEISLALKFRSVDISDFENIDSLREFLVANINTLRRYRQKGVVSQYNKRHFDVDVREFVKIGDGSLGGKARGLAFVSDLFRQHDDLQKRHPHISIKVPKTLVICTDQFDAFVGRNNLRSLLRQELSDDEVTEKFINAKMSEPLVKNLYSYLKQATYPLSIRSSSQMEDAQYQPYAGLYRTYKIPNNHPMLSTRLDQLVKAIKLVYASTYFQGPRSFSKSTANQHSKETMAVIIQQVVGEQYGDYYYPSISGIAQSYNYYPFAKMKAEEGVVHMALGLGKTVVDGEKCIRFSPIYPNNIPEFSQVKDILKNSQQWFYALKTKNYPFELNFKNHSNLEKRSIYDAADEYPVKLFSSTYVPGEERIRDTWDMEGPKVLTFARILKYNLFGIPEVLLDLLKLGQKGFGCAVEIEFAANIYPQSDRKIDLYFLQIRPMLSDEEHHNIKIENEDLEEAFCFSSQALGNGINKKMMDIVYIKPDNFKKSATQQIAEEIERINAILEKEERTYLLAGPGRWGGSDRWLGIPVKWQQISSVGAIVELRNKNLNADPSQGSHFFHNITSMGIHYIMLDEINQRGASGSKDFFDWDWVDSLPAVSETPYIRHVTLDKPMILKIDGRTSKCVIMKP
ncbi:phosphoenolpyruvate synthase/pyruvate phosphate dikinase [bacterium]|nr:phosphoenolpyruvate synthase/pyruvate phosphate dikinase [bacterium]